MAVDILSGIIVIILVFLVYLIYKRTINYTSLNGIFMFVAFILAFLLKLNSSGFERMGLRVDNFFEAAIPAGIITIIGFLVFFIFLQEKKLTFKPELFLLYLIFGILQTIFFQSVFNLTIYDLFNSKTLSILFTTAFFSLFHYNKKNKTFFILAILGGLAWSTIFLYSPNVFALGFSHAIIAYFYYNLLYKGNILKKRIPFKLNKKRSR